MAVYQENDPMFVITEEKIKKAYEKIPSDVKSNVIKAYRWGMKKLIKLDGKGWENSLYKTHNFKYVYCLSRPEWKCDHVGDEQENGTDAIIRAILEYEIGFWNVSV